MAAGTDSTTSSLTSTSHTLTQAPGMASLLSGNDVPSILAFLESCKPANRHAFLQPPSSIPTASLQFAKNTLDAFAGQVSDEQQRALAKAGKKRKRGLENGVARRDVLKIRKLHVDGFETDQVWQQAKRIISSALSQSKEALKELQESHTVQPAATTQNSRENGIEARSDISEDLQDNAEESSSSSDEDVGDSDLEAGDLDEGEDEDENEIDLEGDDGSEALGEEDDELEEDDDDDDDDDENGLAQPDAFYTEDPNGLNDGFFSIDDFNKQTQWLEDQDARADPNTDVVSDEEEGLDWHNDPMSAQMPNGKPKKRRKNADVEPELGLDEDEEAEEEDDDGEDDDGPTFGNMDLFAPEGASEDEADNGPEGDMGLDLTANDIFYKDFFAPPAKRVKKGAKPPRATNTKPSRPDDNEVERAMADVRRDLFDDISERSDSEDALSEVSAGDPRSRRSAHERRQAKILDEIRKLEAEAVKAKKWTMSGEASASARPLDSLLEEELEFEHAGKPVPVITQEVSESIEDMVKRRIVEQKFDEVLRRRPGADELLPNGARRGLVEIDDAKGQQSLAEIYEEEHVKKNNPDTYVSQSDEKLQKEEKEIERMWKELSGKLDALSSWHYKPKPAAPSLTVVADVATIAMEDAQPTTAQGVGGGGQSMMAPQEVYKAGADTAEKGEVVVAKSGLPVARQEMTREDKLRRRRRQKERIRKSDDTTNGKPTSKKAQEKRDTVAELKRGGVKVINRQGEVLDIDGKKAKTARPVTSGSYKL